MPQLKNTGMPQAGPVPAMPPSPAGLPQTKPGPTAVTQNEPDPDDLTRIFNMYTSGQIDRANLIEQLRNISTGRGGILALLEGMEGENTLQEGAGSLAPVPPGPLPGSPPALVPPEVQPDLDARHQRISQMLQGYGLESLDADQMSTELNPIDEEEEEWIPGTPIVGTKVDEGRYGQLKTRAEARSSEDKAWGKEKLAQAVKTSLPSAAAQQQAATGGGMVIPDRFGQAADLEATPAIPTIPTPIEIAAQGSAQRREQPGTGFRPASKGLPEIYDTGVSAPLPEIATTTSIAERYRKEQESQIHTMGGVDYYYRDGEFVPVEQELMAKGHPGEDAPSDTQGGFTFDSSTGTVTLNGKKITFTDDSGNYIDEAGNKDRSSNLRILLQEWSKHKAPTLRGGQEVTWGQRLAGMGVSIGVGSRLGVLPGVAAGKLVGNPLDSRLFGGNDFVVGFAKGVAQHFGFLSEGEAREFSSSGFNFTREIDFMKQSTAAGQYANESEFVADFTKAAIEDLNNLAVDLKIKEGPDREAWIKEQTLNWRTDWNRDAKAAYKTYETTAGGAFDYTSEAIKRLTPDDLISNFADLYKDNPTALSGLADHILEVAKAKGYIDKQGEWDMKSVNAKIEHEASQAALDRKAQDIVFDLEKAYNERDFFEARKQFKALQEVNNAKLALNERRLDWDIDQAKKQAVKDEQALTGWIKTHTWEEGDFGWFMKTVTTRTLAGMEIDLLTEQIRLEAEEGKAQNVGWYRYEKLQPDGSYLTVEERSIQGVQNDLADLNIKGEVFLYDNDGKPIMVKNTQNIEVHASIKSLGQKEMEQDLLIETRRQNFEERKEFGTAQDERPLLERNPNLSTLLTGLEGLRTRTSGMDAAAGQTHFSIQSNKLITSWLVDKGATETDLQVPWGVDEATNMYALNDDGSLKMRTGSIEEAAAYLSGKLLSITKQGTEVTEAQLIGLLPVEPKPDPMTPEGMLEAGAPFSAQISAAELAEKERAEKARLQEEARQFNTTMELQREMLVLEQMQLDTAMQRLFADQRRVTIEDKLANSTILSSAEQITVSKQLADIQQQIADVNRDQMIAEFSGMLNDEPTLAGQEFALSKMLAKATATGEITIDGVTQDTLELSRFMWEKDMENKKLTLETARLDQERQIAQQTTTLAENRYALDAAIQAGELQNAIEIRKNTMLIEQQKMLLERDKLRTDTLLALSNPGLMVFVQRYKLMDELGAALGIDFSDEVPTAASMWDTTAYPFPTAQQLKGMSATERQIVLAESAAAADFSLEAAMGTIAGAVPGYQEIQTLKRPTMLTGEAR